MIIRELLITEPDRGSGCAAHRALLIWVAALVCTILTCDTKFVVIFPITGHARPGLLHVSDRSPSLVQEPSRGLAEIVGDVQARKR
jgi:hypothetical protein